MDFEKYKNLKDIHYLSSYEPEEMRYARYAAEQPTIIATGHKLIDTYKVFCNAREMLHYAYTKDWGELSSGTDESNLFCSSQMLIAAILEYSICLDISWQVIWASFYPSSLTMLINNDYKKIEELCTSTSVHEQLNCVIGLHGIGYELAKKVKCLLTEFENKDIVKKVRSINNAVKHRGTIHIEGLGTNDNSLDFIINNKKIPKLFRDSYSIEMIESLLIDYDNALADYIKSLADILISEDYKTLKCNLSDFITSLISISEAIE